MNLPNYNNVYGSFESNISLEELATYIRREHSNSLLEVKVDKLRDGAQTILLKDRSMELSSRKLDNGINLFSGAVAGDLKNVLFALDEIGVIFKRHGLSVKFEVYDLNYECIGEVSS